MATLIGIIQAAMIVTCYLTLTFGAGMYAGIYVTQNYEVPRVDEPSRLWEKVKDWAESHKKKD